MEQIKKALDNIGYQTDDDEIMPVVASRYITSGGTFSDDGLAENPSLLDDIAYQLGVIPKKSISMAP